MKTKKAVYVVDDDPSMLKAVQRLLSIHGFRAVMFGSANELRLHDNFEQAFCLVLDINLGTESGITLRQELSASGVNLPVIYMSGRETFKATALASGCVAFLTKPFSPKSLIEPVQKLWANVA